MTSPRLLLLCLAVLAAFGGCRRAAVHTYLAPKEAPSGEVPAGGSAPSSGSPTAEPAHPRIAWDTPPSWVPVSKGQMSAVNFDINGDGGKATVNVTVLASFAGREGMVINMWRDQVGAAPLAEEAAAAALSEVPVAGASGKLFEVNGDRGGKPNRIITAMLHRADGSWFFKMAGDELVVQAQKPAFLHFLQTFRFEGDEAPAHP